MIWDIHMLLLFQLVSLNSFNWYQFDPFCILIIVYCVCMFFNWYHLLWLVLILFHTHIHVYLCLRYKFSQTLFMLELKFLLYFNWFIFQLVSYFKPTQCFFWYFIKGEKMCISYSISIGIWFPLPCFMIENIEFQFGIICF